MNSDGEFCALVNIDDSDYVIMLDTESENHVAVQLLAYREEKEENSSCSDHSSSGSGKFINYFSLF